MPRPVCIVIPCFDKGNYIDEAVYSALQQTYQDVEIVIVDDGSRDSYTKEKLRSYYRDPRIRVIHTDNQGVSRARNRGIAESQAEYILPLDADDKIEKDYVRYAVEVLDSDENVGIVYCLATFFDEKNEIWSLPPYSKDSMLLDNMIFCSAFFRKRDWQRVNGYNPNMRTGYEDWDYWLSLIELGLKVYCIPHSFFHYRMRDRTARHLITGDKGIDLEMRTQLLTNHPKLYSPSSLSDSRDWVQSLLQRGYVRGVRSRQWMLARSMRMANAILLRTRKRCSNNLL